MFTSQSISTCFVVTASVAVLALSCAVVAQDHALRKGFEALYAKQNKAIKAKDGDAIESLMAKDYTSKDEDGKVSTRTQAVKKFYVIFASIKEVTSFATKVGKIKQGKDENEVVIEVSDAGTFTMMGPDGQTHLVEGTAKSRDTWVRTSAGWKLKYHEALSSNTSVDGKPAP